MRVSSIATINRLPQNQKREIYARLIPPEVLDHFNLNPFLADHDGNDLLVIEAAPESPDAELSLYHQHGFRDPIIFGHLTDTMNGQIHVLLYIMNDPDSPRFDVDRTPDGQPTKFGTRARNLQAEAAAIDAGLLPGQVRRGLNMLSEGEAAFEVFVKSLGHNIYFVDPLYYHNAIVFEGHGFAYQSGRRLMQRIHEGFSTGGDLLARLDGSTFRKPGAAESIRLRSWAIHDGVLGEPFDRVTMYKVIGRPAGIATAPGVPW